MVFHLLFGFRPRRLVAVASIAGGPLAPQINGTVWFRDVPGGTEVQVRVTGFPPYRPAMGGLAFKHIKHYFLITK